MKTALALHDEIPRILETRELRSLRGKDFLEIEDVNAHQMYLIFHLAERFKEMHARKMTLPPLLHQKTIALLFEKPSTRTRTSFDAGIHLLGGHAVFIDKQSTQMGRGEDWKDTAHTLTQYTDAIMARVYEHASLETMAKASPHPVINGLTNQDHPCQIISDLFTMREHFHGTRDLTVMYTGVSDNITDSLLVGCAMLGVNAIVASPKMFPVDSHYLRTAQKIAKKTGAEIRVFTQLPEKNVLKNVNVVYTDEWESMHMHLDKKKIAPALQPLQVNERLLSQCAKNVRAMHCLPATKGEEITEKTMYGKQSIIWEQAQNRMWVQMGLLSALLYSTTKP